MDELRNSGVLQNMSWAKARWNSILHVLTRLLILLRPICNWLAAEASDPKSRCKKWAAEKLKLFTYDNLVNLGCLVEGMAAGSDFIHSLSHKAAGAGGSIARLAFRVQEFWARLRSLFGATGEASIPLVFQEAYSMGWVNVVLRAIKDSC